MVMRLLERKSFMKACLRHFDLWAIRMEIRSLS